MAGRVRLALLGLCAVAASSAIGSGPARADVVTTKDGLVLEGAVVRAADGAVTVKTDAGEVRLAASAIASVETGEGPRSAAKKTAASLAPGDVEGRFRLALSLEAKGLPDLAREQYEAVLSIDPNHAAARRALGYEKVDDLWMSTADARKRRGLVLYGGRWMLPQEVDLVAKPRRAAPKDASTAATMHVAATGAPPLASAARERLATVAVGERLETAVALLLDGDARVRRFACAQIADAGDSAGLRPLLASAVRDRDEGVRRAAIRAAATFGHEDTAIPLVRALDSEHPGIVANAAKALAMLGDDRAVRYIVIKIEGHGSGPKSYFESVTQHSYISDFDVEVAQTSSIADPIVGVVQEGVVQAAQVLDASIERTLVQRVFVDAVNALAHTSFSSPEQVAAWWHEHASEFPGFERPKGSRAATTTGATK